MTENQTGLPGFEPGHDETKTRCLTAWPQPNLLQHYSCRILSLLFINVVFSYVVPRGVSTINCT